MNKARLGRRRGTAAIETAAALPVLLLLLIAATDFAFVSLVEHQLGHAARVGSRYGITGQSPETIDASITPVRWCDGEEQASSDRLTIIRQLIADATGGVLKREQLCLSVLSYTGGYAAVGQPEPHIDKNGNGAWDPGEAYTDTNGDGAWSADQGAAALGEGGIVAVYALRYTTGSVTGLTPGLADPMAFEARLVVRNEPFQAGG